MGTEVSGQLPGSKLGQGEAGGRDQLQSRAYKDTAGCAGRVWFYFTVVQTLRRHLHISTHHANWAKPQAEAIALQYFARTA